MNWKEIKLREKERLDDLIHAELKIIQSQDYFAFSIDAVLLADFVTAKAGAKVIDLGTGCGVIPLLLAAQGAAKDIVGVEIQSELADMASRSVSYNNLEELIEIKNLDIKDLKSEYEAESFEVVVSNPPYLPLGQGKVSSKRSIAVAKHEVELELEQLVEVSAYLLKYGGEVCYIYRSARLTELLEQLVAYNLEPKSLRLVYPNLEAEANLVLVKAVKGANKGLEVAKPLLIYEADGSYTEELLQIYYGENY
ncbi:tRNA1(Val) (adenine(37)-N6)-methyltransferase [Fuchsiella alkaliacetigena]|uniref:tRNA1(Val) (adenine(37)-N6)-methyltransferase n=1 Tax=Fuchsiella alkaliacetigena TaxID=957042 RepID=UPI00200AB981|nr:tRNA1(Val) (adenine(37)-N6)-methyltransferase [Fuchsiella alkaliacetigena]MCK8824497.1 tRNA1(Val) (adenine(37)-N6)-methyltransferase [Fuchsiella alkaliacetigena]